MDVREDLKRIIVKIIVSVIAMVVMLIPVWIFLLAWWMITPEDFLQKLVIVVISAIFLGKIQSWLCFIIGTFIIAVWLDEL